VERAAGTKGSSPDDDDICGHGPAPNSVR
jgi:hypothetical protein